MSFYSCVASGEVRTPSTEKIWRSGWFVCASRPHFFPDRPHRLTKSDGPMRSDFFMHRGQGLSPILANTFPRKVARNLLLAERFSKPELGGIHGGERGLPKDALVPFKGLTMLPPWSELKVTPWGPWRFLPTGIGEPKPSAQSRISLSGRPVRCL